MMDIGSEGMEIKMNLCYLMDIGSGCVCVCEMKPSLRKTKKITDLNFKAPLPFVPSLT